MFESFLKWKSVDFSMETHVSGAEVLWSGEEGKVCRWYLRVGKKTELALPDFLRKMNRDRRQKLAAKLNFNWAGRGGVRGVGKPSSTFLIRDRRGLLFIDYFVESHQHKRSKGIRLHDFIRQNVSYDFGVFMRSGHIAPLNVTEEDIGFILLLDNLDSSSWVGDVSLLETLWFNRILVISSNGYLVGRERSGRLSIA